MPRAEASVVPGSVRIWHWLTAALFLVLTLTGIDLHFADADSALIMDYGWANSLHDWTGLALSGIYVVFLVLALGTGYGRNYVPEWRGLWADMRHQAGAYLRGKDRQPGAEMRFNPLQRLSYLLIVFGVLPLLVITGLIFLYYPGLAPGRFMGMAGLWPIAQGHYLLAILSTAFLVVHVYMALLGPGAPVKVARMVRGQAKGDPEAGSRR